MNANERALVQLLKEEQAAFLRFEKLLEEESQALVLAAPDKLLAVVDKKAQATEGLHALSEERAALLERLGLNADDVAQVKEWFNLRPPRDELSAQWDKLLEIGRSVVRRNASNGRLIHQRLESTQESLSVLRKAVGAPELYGRDGKIKTPFSTGY